jgi:hypothetical protein
MEEWRDDDERASVDGPVPAKTTWQDWLSKQPDDVVRDILGPTRFQLYKQGMAVTSFVSDGKALNLRQLVEKEGFELFGAGLKDKSWQFKNAYANTYYDSIRNRKNPTDIDKIAANSGLSQKDIRSIRDHLFIKEHDLGEGDYGRFSSNWQIAQAWQRMEQGWAGNEMEQYKAADILLLNHEREELTQMSKHGYNALQAHEIAESKYPWDIAIDKIDKVK